MQSETEEKTDQEEVVGKTETEAEEEERERIKEARKFSLPKEYQNESPLDLIKEIQQIYFTAKKQKMSRFDLKWSLWSSHLNTFIRGKLKENQNYALAFLYWKNYSELLELNYNKPLGKFLQKKKLQKIINSIRKEATEQEKKGGTK